jgi:hypothetical protein
VRTIRLAERAWTFRRMKANWCSVSFSKARPSSNFRNHALGPPMPSSSRLGSPGARQGIRRLPPAAGDDAENRLRRPHPPL